MFPGTAEVRTEEHGELISDELVEGGGSWKELGAGFCSSCPSPASPPGGEEAQGMWNGSFCQHSYGRMTALGAGMSISTLTWEQDPAVAVGPQVK